MDPNEDDNARLSAMNKYERHPHGGDVREVIRAMLGLELSIFEFSYIYCIVIHISY